MRFGNVIFNPFSKEAEALLGKRVKASKLYSLLEEDNSTGLARLESTSYLGFHVRWEKTGKCSDVNFVKEVLNGRQVQ